MWKAAQANIKCEHMNFSNTEPASLCYQWCEDQRRCEITVQVNKDNECGRLVKVLMLKNLGGLGRDRLKRETEGGYKLLYVYT